MKRIMHRSGLVDFCLAPILVFSSAPSGPWDAFNYAPKSRTVWPASVYSINGNVDNPSNLINATGSATLTGNGTYVALDFGLEVGGLISLNFEDPSASASISLSFTESPLYISPVISDDSGNIGVSSGSWDGVESVAAPLPAGFWTQPAGFLRGGFRYLTLVSNSDDPVTISNVSVAISFSPHVDDLRDYSGYFYASDPCSADSDFLTKLWYAGAYTVQTNTIDANTGRFWPTDQGTWNNSAQISDLSPVLVYGAKRDRTIWPGDQGVAVPTQFVSTNDLIATHNNLVTLFAAQNTTTGELAGYESHRFTIEGSDTYHGWTLVSLYNYYIYSGDIDFVKSVWTGYTAGVAFLENKVDSSGLVYVTGTGDWQRQGQGGRNSAANAIFYRILATGVELATAIGDDSLAAAWAVNASSVKNTYNTLLWDATAGLYRDNDDEGTTLHPQDGNALAVLFNVTDAADKATTISMSLTQNWNDIGAVTPEYTDTISPFISSFEIQAHFKVNHDDLALDLIRREWGFMLTTNTSVQSTLLEGFKSDGSLAYYGTGDPTYTSHAHGWSTGPTSALTFYVLGLTVTSAGGATWSVAPHLSGLPAAQGGFTTPLGWYGVQWTNSSEGFVLDVQTPGGTSGVVRVPVQGALTVDGQAGGSASASEIALAGGNHTITVTPA